MGKWRAIITFVLALGVALLSSYFIYMWVQHKTVPPTIVAPVQEESVLVAAAVTDLPWGTKLTREMITTVPFFEKSLPKGYFSDASSLEGRVVIIPLERNEVIIESKLAPKSVAAGGVAAVVKPGKRALAVKGDKVIGLSGFIRPGDRVDVLVTLSETGSRRERQISKVVLEDILVLATGAQMEQGKKKGKGGETFDVDVYTLEVTPEEGEKLALAATQGRLHFALRNATDTETVLTTGATVPETLASFRTHRKKRHVASAPVKGKPVKGTKAKEGKKIDDPGNPFYAVQLIKGNRVSVIKFETAER